MSEGPPGVSGHFAGRVHHLPVRVYYEDTDVSGIVYHANYLRYFERGRSEFLRLAGIHHMVMLEGETPLAWTLRNIMLDYQRPARLDDLLTVHTRFIELSGARMTAAQVVMRGELALVRARVEAAVITLEGRPRRIPADVRAKMAPYLDPDA